MRHLYGLLMVLVFAIGLTFPADAGSGHRMAEGQMTPQLLAERIEASLQRDPSGNAVVAGTACSTPRHFLEAIEEMQGPRFGRDWGAFTDYLRSLRRVENVAAKLPGTYRMSRTLGPAGGPCSLDLAGYSRQFRSSEHGWRDAEGRLVFAGDCTNVTGEALDRTTAATAPPPSRDVCPSGYVLLKSEKLAGFNRPRVFTTTRFPPLEPETHREYDKCWRCTKWNPPRGDPILVVPDWAAWMVPRGTSEVCVPKDHRTTICDDRWNNDPTEIARDP